MTFMMNITFERCMQISSFTHRKHVKNVTACNAGSINHLHRSYTILSQWYDFYNIWIINLFIKQGSFPFLQTKFKDFITTAHINFNNISHWSKNEDQSTRLAPALWYIQNLCKRILTASSFHPQKGGINSSNFKY